MLNPWENASSTMQSTSSLNVTGTRYLLRSYYVNKRIQDPSTLRNFTAMSKLKYWRLIQLLRWSLTTAIYSYTLKYSHSEKIMQAHSLRRLSIIKSTTPWKRAFAAILKHQFPTNNFFIPITATKQSYICFETIICRENGTSIPHIEKNQLVSSSFSTRISHIR